MRGVGALIHSLLSLTILTFGAGRVSADTAEKPNIVLIMVDDLGKEWIGCYGAEQIRTPHIDSIAAGGMRFTSAYSMPQCTPTRVTLLTGQYPWRTGWVNHWDVPRWGVGYFDWRHYTTVARLLRESGYATAAAGKWQINDFRLVPDAMHKHGFDEWCMWTGFETGNRPSAERYWNPYIHTRKGSSTHAGAFGPDVYTDFLIDFMRRNRERPMFLYFPMALTHGPLVHTPDQPDVKEKLEKHRAMVTYTDKLVGKIVQAVDDLGIRERTIVFFTTDNGSGGGITGVRAGRRVKGGKGSKWESGVCAPFIVNGPGLVPPGTVSSALTDFTDLLPTFVDLAGSTLPVDLKLDGVSIAPVVLGKARHSGREFIAALGHGPARLDSRGVRGQFDFASRVIRDRRFKAWVDTERSITALYDLESDPWEERNLVDSQDSAPRAALKKFEAAVQAMPVRDGRPRYEPRAPNEWDRKLDRSLKEGSRKQKKRGKPQRAASERTKPHIVLILADDMGYGDVRALNPESRIPTPNLDRLAAEGMTFTDAHSPSSVCTPTRYGLLTGRYCWRSRLKRGVLGGYSPPLIEKGRSTIATMLKKNGYHTGAVGKWHLGMDMPRKDGTARDDTPWAGDPGIDFAGVIADSPVHHGFDEYFGVSASLDMAPYVYIRNDRFTMQPTLAQKAVPFPHFVRNGPRAEDFVISEVLDKLTEEAVSFIQRAVRGDQPFFLYLPLTAPHKPTQPHERFRGKTRLGEYGDFVAQVDWSIGRVLQAVDEAGVARDTLVFYSSDNGSYMYRYTDDRKDHVDDRTVQGFRSERHRANGPFRGTKADVWEGGHRVPLLVRWPGEVEAGSKCSETVCLVDLYATCAAILGADVPDGAAEDSSSLLKLLRGQPVGRGAPVIHHSVAGMYAIRDGKWKLILGNGSGGRESPRGKPFGRPYQLFDMTSDASETVDVAEKHPEVVERLTQTFERIRQIGRTPVDDRREVY